MAEQIKIAFLETETSERNIFEESLGQHALRFEYSLKDVLPEADILSGFLNSTITEEFLASHSAIRMIAARSTSCDHIDLDACKRRNILICNVPSYGNHTVAEHTFALILAASRRLREAMESHKHRKFSYEDIRGFELRGKTLGVIGAGRIGQNTIRFAKAFGMNPIAFDLEHNTDAAKTIGFRYVPLDELLAQSHVISLHTALTPETFHMIDGKAFAKCRRGVIIVNTGRGALIDTDALVAALDDGIVAGAALDVLEEESVMRKDASHIISEQIVDRIHAAGELRAQDPSRINQLRTLMRNQSLLERPNVVFTPHVAFNTVETIRQISRATVDNINAFLSGQPINLVHSAIPA